jgi:hypothetical protein
MDNIKTWNLPTADSRRGKTGLDNNLADWIERDPSLVCDGLLIVARDLPTEAGTLDLLGIDPAGRWVVIVVKPGRLRRDTITRAVDLAACIARMDEDDLITAMDGYLARQQTDTPTLLTAHQIDDESLFRKRETAIYVIGTGADHPLEPFRKNPSPKERPIHVLSFDLVENDAGKTLLARRSIPLDVLSKPKEAQRKQTPPPLKHWPTTPAIERLLKIAADHGVGDGFRLIHETSVKHGMYPRTYRWSIMYAPPQNRTRCLICLWAKREKPDELVVYIAAEAFAEFYPIPEQVVEETLCANHWHRIPLDQAATFASRIDNLFETISGNYEVISR